MYASPCASQGRSPAAVRLHGAAAQRARDSSLPRRHGSPIRMDLRAGVRPGICKSSENTIPGTPRARICVRGAPKWGAAQGAPQGRA
eukprot:8764313-Pyramimonas_sp.AAC.2